MAKISVKDTEVNIIKVNGEEYICLTYMLRAKDGDCFITDWLRNRNALEFIGIWEKVYNPNFNYGEFAIIRNQAGLNSFKISVKEFMVKTNTVSLQARAGRYGGIYAMFSLTAKQWRDANPELKRNIRDYASINDLICLSNMENLNAVFIAGAAASTASSKPAASKALNTQHVAGTVASSTSPSNDHHTRRFQIPLKSLSTRKSSLCHQFYEASSRKMSCMPVYRSTYASNMPIYRSLTC